MDSSLYVRPNKPMFGKIRARSEAPERVPVSITEPLIVDRYTECHVTPCNVASNMADYLNLFSGLSVLEPSAGSGNLIAAILETGHKVTISAVEKHGALYSACVARFADKEIIAYNDCFFSFAASHQFKFDRILMNPPFSRVKDHIEAAISLLAADGILCALVPITFKHDLAYEVETLDRDTFITAKVATKIILIEK